MAIGTGNSLVLFNDGEEVVESDFNALQNALTERAWEMPGWHDMAAFDQFGSTYETAFIYGPGDGRKYGVFTKGGGLLPSYSGLGSSLAGGLIGIWSTPMDGTPPVDPTVARAVRWVSLWGGEWSHTHDAAGSGKYRYDIVTCKIDEGDSGTLISRSFEDATTGALTTQNCDKQTALTLDLVAATAVTKGTEAASEGAATIPAIPSGRHLLYYVLVHYTAIEKVFDCTIPAGSLITGTMFPVQGYGRYPVWTESGLIITSTTNSEAVLLPPPEITGDPSVRVLGFCMSATLKATDTVQMVALDPVAGTTANIGPALSTQFTRDSGPHTQMIDLRGLPASTGCGPMWANGAATKQNVPAGDTKTLAICVTAAGSGTVIRVVTWYAIRG